MNDLMTMSIKPYEKINIGLMIARTLCDILDIDSILIWNHFIMSILETVIDV